jgi:hypothetical protein
MGLGIGRDETIGKGLEESAKPLIGIAIAIVRRDATEIILIIECHRDSIGKTGNSHNGHAYLKAFASSAPITP